MTESFVRANYEFAALVARHLINNEYDASPLASPPGISDE